MLVLAGCGGSDDSAAPGDPPAPTLPTLSFVAPGESLDLNNYTLVGRYTLPVAAGAGVNQISAEVSAVTYNSATDSLFIVGDEGTYVTQLSKRGEVIDTMNLPAGLFADPEGITAIGGGQFVVADERVRTASRFTYQAGTTLDPATVKSVKLATTVGNVGVEGVTFDPLTGGYVFVKELTPSGIFQTTIDFTAGTASNGSAATVEPTNLFDPALAGVADFGDVAALSNVLPASAADASHLMVLSNDTGRILKLDRAGRIYSSLDILQSAQHEGITFDRDLNMYVTNEAGGGSQALPQMWVYAPTRSASAVGVGSNLYLTFTADVSVAGGNIVLTGSGGDVRTIPVGDATQVSLSGRTVRINPAADLLPGQTYTVQYAGGVLRAGGDNVPATSAALTFTTVADITEPTLLSATPLDDAMGVAVAADIVLNFDEAVRAGAGTFTISNGTDDVRVISAADTTQVSISGSTVTINPTADLRLGTGYRVLVSANALADLSGNSYAGISDTTRLNFSTMAATPPTALVAGDLLFIAVNGDAPDAIAFILMRDIATGTQIGFSDRDSLTATNEAAFLWTADQAYPTGTIVTIQTDNATPIADKGSIVGAGGGISTGSETYFAFQGAIPPAPVPAGEPTLVVDRYLAAINLGTAGPFDATLQPALGAAGAFFSIAPDDNVRFNGSLSTADLPALRARIADPANWSRDNTTAFPITGGSLFP
ncbi:MAG TPA: SdiA-regulated domain-containing protein [Ramlibacter sp.]|nr:SdiA-regulated domain-containing protein [Ramlibacter sp.]